MTTYVPGYMIKFKQVLGGWLWVADGIKRLTRRCVQFAKLNTSFLSMLSPAIDFQRVFRNKIFGNQWWLRAPKDAMLELKPIPHAQMYIESVPRGDWEAWAKDKPGTTYERTALTISKRKYGRKQEAVEDDE